MDDSEQFFRHLVSAAAPDEIDISVPMLRAHLAGEDIDGDGPAAAGFGIAGVLTTPALLTGLTSIAVIALPTLRALVEYVIPSIGAAADITAIRDIVKAETGSEEPGGVPLENISIMATRLEAELVEAGLDASQSTEVTLACVKALCGDPRQATALMTELGDR